MEIVKRELVLTPPHPSFQIGNCDALAYPSFAAIAEQLQFVLAPALPQDGLLPATAIAVDAVAAYAPALERL
jgi:hypothetical protein